MLKKIINGGLSGLGAPAAAWVAAAFAVLSFYAGFSLTASALANNTVPAPAAVEQTAAAEPPATEQSAEQPDTAHTEHAATAETAASAATPAVAVDASPEPAAEPAPAVAAPVKRGTLPASVAATLNLDTATPTAETAPQEVISTSPAPAPTPRATPKSRTTASPLRLTPDATRIIRLDRDAASVIVSNPKYLGVTLDNPRLLIVMPKMPGTATFTVLDADGDIIYEQRAIITGTQKKYVRIRRMCDSSDAACAPVSYFYCPDGCYEVSPVEAAESGTAVPPVEGSSRTEDIEDIQEPEANTSTGNIMTPPPAAETAPPAEDPATSNFVPERTP